MKNSLSKKEIIRSRKSINNIYQNGHCVYTSYFNAKWLSSTTTDPKIKLLISVPKKNIYNAVDRNYMKRIIRESYMMQKVCVAQMIMSPIEIILIYNKTNAIEFNKLKIELLTLFEMISKKQHEFNK